MSLTRVTFGELSSLKLIYWYAFAGLGLSEIRVPDSVDEFGDKCFCDCKSLSRVSFGELSSLKRIGWQLFRKSGIKSLEIPESIELILSGTIDHKRIRVTKGRRREKRS